MRLKILIGSHEAVASHTRAYIIYIKSGAKVIINYDLRFTFYELFAFKFRLYVFLSL